MPWLELVSECRGANVLSEFNGSPVAILFFIFLRAGCFTTSARQQTSESFPGFPLAHLHVFFFSCHSTTLARCAEKALTALTTACRLRQNPQKRAPSGQTNRRGRQSETCAKENSTSSTTVFKDCTPRLRLHQMLIKKMKHNAKSLR